MDAQVLRPRSLFIALSLGAWMTASVFAADLSGTGIILPVVDRVGDPAIAATVDAAFRGVLEMGVKITDRTPLRDALRRERIRQLHTASPTQIGDLGEALGFDWLCTITVHEAFANPIPQISLSATLYRVGEDSYEWVGLLAATGLDRVTWLGIGLEDDLASLAETTAAELAKRAREFTTGRSSKPRLGIARDGFLSSSAQLPRTGDRVVVLPLDSVADRLALRSAELATISLMAALVERGLEIVHPGKVRQIMLEQGRLFLGEVTSEFRDALHQQAQTEWIMTGTVEYFQQGGGINPEPRVAIGCRLLDAKSGRIVWMDGLDRTGTDSKTVFNQGRVFSTGVLTLEISRSLVAAFLNNDGGQAS